MSYQEIFELVDKFSFAGGEGGPDVETLMNLYNIFEIMRLDLKSRINTKLDERGVHHSSSDESCCNHDHKEDL